MFKKNNKYFENKKYLLKLLDILNQDIYSIYFWFRRIYNLDFTYPTISKLIKDIISFGISVNWLLCKSNFCKLIKDPIFLVFLLIYYYANVMRVN